MKVGVIMFYDDNIKSYGDITYLINKKYCEKYNLEIILSNEKRYKDRYPAWERLPLILENISKFEYLIWIDADAFFYNDALNIIDIINCNDKAHFILSNDIGNMNTNTGLFIVKNSQYSIDFLTKWAYDENLYNNNMFPGWWDQGVFIDMYIYNMLNIQENSVNFEYGILHHFHKHDKLENTFVFHMAGMKNDERYEIAKKYLDENMI